jgi:hypothetical protein
VSCNSLIKAKNGREIEQIIKWKNERMEKNPIKIFPTYILS